MEARHPVILLLDDQTVELNALSVLLSECGYRVLAESDARAACDYLQRRVSIDVVLSSTHLREDGAGYRVLETWRLKRPATPIVAITPDKDVASAVKAMRLGASDCVTQPVDPQALLAALDRLAAESSSRRSTTDLNGFQGTGFLRSLDGLTIAELERLAITQTLQKCNGNRTMAARRLGISVRTLQRKLRKWDRDGTPSRTRHGIVDLADAGNVPPPLSSAPFSTAY